MVTAETYSEQRLAELEDFFENALIGLHIVGADGTIKRANWADMEPICYGETPEKYLTRNISEFHADQAVINDMLQRLLNNQPLVNYQAQLVASDGSTRSVVIYSNSRMSGDTFVNTRCFTRPCSFELMRDMANRKLPTVPVAEKLATLTEAEKHQRFDDLNDFFENASLCLHIVDANGIIKRANRVELEFMGYADHPEEYIGHHVAEFHADKDAIEDILQRLLNNEFIINYPAKLRTREGSVRSVTIFSNSRFENGKFINTRCFTYPNSSNNL